MPLRFDLHTHSRFSADGISDPEKMVASARKKGLHGFAITDHNTCEAVDYMLEAGIMREDGLPVDGLLVIPGVEVTTANGHLLCIGVSLPDLKGRPAAEVCRIIHEQGGVAIAPHPFDRFRAGIRRSCLDEMDVDAIEVFNSAVTLKRHNFHAHEYALRRRIAMAAGSDAHHHSAIGTAYTLLHTDDFSLPGVLKQIPRENTIEGSYLSKHAWALKTLSNALRLPRRLKQTLAKKNGNSTAK